ncbi:hypothetical protein LSH36_1937g00006 [Paralvinella palmiformis]|uniref:L-Fucosyltransferase n=1 Tax=Paralvinella palmiformis TaxID=53620 RepID=A0AAD9IS16_9ANNE|nr:hypothetical protein LSH36_1937g00006 [Paralvinella palmiformis]
MNVLWRCCPSDIRHLATMLGDATFMLGVNHSAIIRYDKTNNKDRLVLSILRQGRLGNDDIKWARKHLLGDDITFATNHTGALDMAILASCDHVIVGNGSFSWWVGWLCTGSTVRYKWMPKYDSHLYNFTRGEYWPPNDTYNHYIAIDSD